MNKSLYSFTKRMYPFFTHACTPFQEDYSSDLFRIIFPLSV